jgi:hypothetical protein
MRIRIAVGLSVPLLAWALAGCGGHTSAGAAASSAASSAPSSTVTAAVTAAVTASAPGTSSAAAPTAGGSPSISPCTAADLRFTATGQSSAGSSFFRVTATDEGRACSIDGFFGAAGYDPLTATTTAFTNPTRDGVATALTVRPGQAVAFLITAGYDTPTGSVCAPVSALLVTPPNTKQSATVTVQGPSSHGAMACDQATIDPPALTS